MKTAYLLFLILLALNPPVPLLSQEVEDLNLTPPQLENRLLEWVNKERQKRALHILKTDPQLIEVARAHSRKMAAEKKLGHDFADYDSLSSRLVKAGLYFTYAGENVARGDTFVMRIVHQSLMDSPGHRVNILSGNFTHLGIGIVFDGDLYYTTQVFSRLYTPKNPLKVESELIGTLHGLLPEASRSPITNAADLLEICRKRAGDFLAGHPNPNLPDSWKWGKAELTSNTFNENYEITSRLAQEIKSEPCSWILGVSFRRTALNPGGCYAVSMVKFPHLSQNDDLGREVFTRLNEARVKNGKSKAIWFDPLARNAENLAQSYLVGNKGTTGARHYRLFYAYETFDIGDIPDFVIRKVSKMNLKTLGVHVLYPQEYRPYRNILIVAMVGQ